MNLLRRWVRFFLGLSPGLSSRTLRNTCIAGVLLALVSVFFAVHPLRRVQAQGLDPSVYGAWGNPFPTGNDSLGLPAVLMTHAVVLPSGKVLFWDAQYSAGQLVNVYLWDPATTDQFAQVYLPQRPKNDADPPNETVNNIFCAGLNLLPSGRLLVTGGQTRNGIYYGLDYTNLFDPFANNGAGAWWTGDAPDMTLPSMAQGRWYPTNTPLGNGAVVIQSGTVAQNSFVQTPEVWQPDGNGNWILRALTGAAAVQLPYYPWSYTDPRPGHEGWVYVAGPSTFNDALNTNDPGSWTGTGPNRSNSSVYPSIREYGSSVLYGPGRILVAGGRDGTISGDLPTNTAEIVNLYDSQPAWQPTGSMSNSRKYMNLTVMPDGKVIATGGTSGGCLDESNEYGFSVKPTEIWDPNSGNWTYAGDIYDPRLYHSVGFLLPDARVVVGGGGEGGSCGSYVGPQYDFATHLTARIYSPAYLFRGGNRPVIGNILSGPQDQVGYNETMTFAAQSDSAINRVTLVRLPAVTHSFNQNQWFYEMQIIGIVDLGGGSSNVTVATPPRWEELPPGHYMMFALDGNGVPSVAKIMRFRDPNVPWHQQ